MEYPFTLDELQNLPFDINNSSSIKARMSKLEML